MCHHCCPHMLHSRSECACLRSHPLARSLALVPFSPACSVACLLVCPPLPFLPAPMLPCLPAPPLGKEWAPGQPHPRHMQGKKSCHTGYRKTSGWTLPLWVGRLG